MTRLLVAYATGSGSTAEVATAIAEELQSPSVQVDVLNVRDVAQLEGYDAVVLGSSIRAGRWLPEAVDFWDAFQEQLAAVPVALFTTCLTMARGDEEARSTVLSYMEPILRRAPDIRPVGIGLFAGSLDPARTALLPSQYAPQGDYRNWDAIRAWAREIRPALVESRPGPLSLAEVTLSHTDLSKLDLAAYDLHRAELRAAMLRETKLTEADLEAADLEGSNLAGADLSYCALGWANLQRCNLHGAQLHHANLLGADLRFADLSQADLRYAVLNGANCRYANLATADLRHANLDWIDLEGANLEGADFREADLSWADLRQVDLTGAQMEGALYNDATQWPEGFDPQEAGCVHVNPPL